MGCRPCCRCHDRGTKIPSTKTKARSSRWGHRTLFCWDSFMLDSFRRKRQVPKGGRYPLRIGQMLSLGRRFQRNQMSDIPINGHIAGSGDNLYGLFGLLCDSDWTFPPPSGSEGERNPNIHGEESAAGGSSTRRIVSLSS